MNNRVILQPGDTLTVVCEQGSGSGGGGMGGARPVVEPIPAPIELTPPRPEGRAYLQVLTKKGADWGLSMYGDMVDAQIKVKGTGWVKKGGSYYWSKRKRVYAPDDIEIIATARGHNTGKQSITIAKDEYRSVEIWM